MVTRAQALSAIGWSPIHQGVTDGWDARLCTPSQAAQTATAWRACWGVSNTCSMLLWFLGFRQALRNEPTVCSCSTCWSVSAISVRITAVSGNCSTGCFDPPGGNAGADTFDTPLFDDP